MSNNTEDVRSKLTPEDHAALMVVALASGEEVASIVRRLILEFLAGKRREYTVAARLMQAKGITGESAGSREGDTP